MSISIPRVLAEDILEELYELQGERHWWKDEPRCNYQKRYEALTLEIEQLKTAIENDRPA